MGDHSGSSWANGFFVAVGCRWVSWAHAQCRRCRGWWPSLSVVVAVAVGGGGRRCRGWWPSLSGVVAVAVGVAGAFFLFTVWGLGVGWCSQPRLWVVLVRLSAILSVLWAVILAEKNACWGRLFFVSL